MSFPDRGTRLRNAFNRLVATTAVLGIGASGWGLWLEKEEYEDRQVSREEIADACAELVDPDRVLGLNGGTARVIHGRDATQWFTMDTLPGHCEIYRVGEPGTSYGHFTLTVWTNPLEGEANVVGNPLQAFEEQISGTADVEDLTRVADHSPEYPLDHAAEDDGRLGHHNDDSATFKVTCKTPKNGVTSVNVVTEAAYDDVSFRDLQTIIELAAEAAYKTAEHVGCTPVESVRYTSFPRLWIPDAKLKQAESADGSCRWYDDFLDGEDLGRLPDRALSSPRGEHGFKETCLLAASPAQVKRVWPELPPSRYLQLDDVLDDLPWVLQTDSFFGDEAREVRAQAWGDDPTIRPGTAGRADLADVWWASSTCDGEPAVHTLSVSSSYTKAISPRLRSLFKAYTDSITTRRDCTNIKFPAPADFSSE